MVWLKNWFALLIPLWILTLPFTLLAGDPDSLEIEYVIHFFDTVSYIPDTLAPAAVIDPKLRTDCSSGDYQVPDALKLYPFRSAKIMYVFSCDTLRDTMWYYIDCYGGKQLFITRKRNQTWYKLMDLAQPVRFIYQKDDPIGYVVDNELSGLIDSLKQLSETGQNNFLERIRMAAGVLCNQMEIHFAGIGRVAGRSCLKIYLARFKKQVWYWKKIILKTMTELSDGSFETIEAHDVKIDLPLADSLFLIPHKQWQKVNLD